MSALIDASPVPCVPVGELELPAYYDSSQQTIFVKKEMCIRDRVKGVLDNFRFETFVDVHSNIFAEYLSSVIAKLPKENPEYYFSIFYLPNSVVQVFS